MPKICIITYEFYPHIEGGTGIAITEIATRLTDYGYHVTVLSLGDKNQERLIKKARVFYFKKHGNKLLKLVSFQFKVFSWLNQNKNLYDVVLFSGTSGCICLLNSFFLLRNKLMITRIASDSLEQFKIQIRNFFKKPSLKLSVYFLYIFSLLEELTCSALSSFVIVPSNYLKMKLSSYGIRNNKISVLSNGIDLDKFDIKLEKKECRKEISIPENVNAALYVGRLSPEKGLFVLFEAIKLVVKHNNRFLLILLGDGPIKKDLIDFAEKLNIDKNVQFAGFINDEYKKAIYYKAADLFILPSETEGLPNVILEALASGLPIIATQAGGIPELVEDGVNGLLIPPKNPEAIANAIVELIDNVEIRNSMIKNNYTKAKKFKWDKIVNELNNLILKNISDEKPIKQMR